MTIYKWAIFLFSLSVISCGGGNTADTVETGALTFGIEWIAPGQYKPADVAGDFHYAVNCASVGVSTIWVEVNNYSTGTDSAKGGPWACSAGSGTINVPVGSNYTVHVIGKDGGGKTVYFGRWTGVSITAGVTNDAGTITVAPVTYTDNGNGTITASATGLMWQKQDDEATRTWDSAKTYCAGLAAGGYAGWRLPTIDELKTIIDTSFGLPTINATYFPNTKSSWSSWYWSSTTNADFTLYTWGASFTYGSVTNHYKTDSYYARCVRLG